MENEFQGDDESKLEVLAVAIVIMMMIVGENLECKLCPNLSTNWRASLRPYFRSLFRTSPI
jgi:hypothetical protein